ncbi:hypothetical protein KY318_02210 [Candidatus Woesearchaeota archaeon]|nr:hypothetical protein [Candidatus Woesearchaeota archaeon]
MTPARLYFKRAQMEVFGLVFVVLLILVGFFIYISLSKLTPEQRFIGADYERTQMASNFIDAVLKVTTQCGHQELGAILAACETPTMGGLQCDSGRTPCEEAKYILGLALEKTLGEMEYHYQLTFKVAGTPKFKIPDEPLRCVERVKAGVYPFQSPITGRMLEVRLDICR